MISISEIYNLYSNLIPVFFIALVASFFLTPIMGKIARSFGFVDLPASLRPKDDVTRDRRLHKKSVPRLGGLAVVIPFAILAFAYLPPSKELVGLAIGTALLAIVGVIDDKKELSGRTQLVAQIIAALIVIASGIGINEFRNPFGGTIHLDVLNIPITLWGATHHISLPADLITMLWILIFINAINWVGGIDGLVEGITAIASFTIILISVKSATPFSGILATILMGAILGFLPFNFHPAKIFSGCAGSPVYGYLLGVISIISGSKVATSILVLIIPLLDMIWVVLGRLKRSRVSKLTDILDISDRTHLHHRLQDLGLSVPQVTLLEYSVVGILAVAAFAASGLMKMVFIGLAALLVLIGFIIISILLTKREVKVKKPEQEQPPPPPTPEESPESRYAY